MRSRNGKEHFDELCHIAELLVETREKADMWDTLQKNMQKARIDLIWIYNGIGDIVDARLEKR